MRKEARAGKFLGPEEVQRRLDAYDGSDEGLFRHLYDFGRAALEEVDTLTERLDTKARTMTVWSAGVIAFILTQIERLPTLARFWGVVAGALAFASGLAAFWSIKVRPSTSFSDKGWFPEPDEARDLIGALKYHVWTASGARERNAGLNRDKGEWLLKSQRLLLAAVFVLALIVALRSVGI